MNQKMKYILYGLCFLIVGIGYLGDAGMLWNFTVFFPGWWTLFLIVPSIVNIVEKGFSFVNILFLCMGIYLFLDANHLIHFNLNIQFIAAVSCTAFGGWLLFKGVSES